MAGSGPAAVKPLVLIVTGLSGSGKTIALRAVEDAGFFCVDNLPPQLIKSFLAVSAERALSEKTVKKPLRMAIGIDIREKHFLPAAYRVFKGLGKNYRVDIVFFEAEKDVIVRRFKETRRPHPLLKPGETDMEKAIALEKELLAPLREIADRIIETSSFSPHQLRSYMLSLYGRQGTTMSVSLMSFGFKYGAPQNTDLLFDVRFLPNPHFVPELKELKGADKAVQRFVLKDRRTVEFIERLVGFLRFLIPQYRREGKTYLTIGIGCTGGRHRSPVIVDKIASMLKQKSHGINVIHRDME